MSLLNPAARTRLGALGPWLLGAVVLLCHIPLFIATPLLLAGITTQVLLCLPGILLALLLFQAEGDPLTRVFLALCGGLAHQILLLLALHALPGPLSWWLVLLPCDAISLWLAWLLIRQPPSPRASLPPLPIGVALALIMLVAAMMRLLFLGGAEVQGDEARSLLLGVDAVNGRDTILLWHSKGPVEVLLPMGPLALLGNTNEFVARLPFALASVGTPLGVFLIARAGLQRVVGAHGANLAGLIAAAIIAVDGFLIAFGRIIQYQSVLVCVWLGALWCAWRFYEGVTQPRRYLLGSAVLAAIALLSHYDAIFIFPALAWLVLAGGWRHGWRGRQWLTELAPPVLLGAFLLACFYVPFMLNEQWAHTLEYLQKRTGRSGLRTVNNLPNYYRLATFYNTTFQINWLGSTLAAAVMVWCTRYIKPRLIGGALALVLLVGCVVMVTAPKRFALEQGNWAIVTFGLPLLALIVAPHTPAFLRTLLLWFSAAFVAESFVIDNPMTHFYTMDAAAALLIGMGVAQLAVALQARLRVLLVPLALAGAALALLATPYAYIVFVRQSPEYRHVFPAARPEIYRASYGDALPSPDGYFGFPHHAGWKVIGQLYEQGILQGSFDSNEDYLITHWYSRKESRCDEWRPNYYFIARSPLDYDKVPNDVIEQSYFPFGTILVEGQPTITIYSDQPVAQPYEFDAAQYEQAFDAQRLADPRLQGVVLDLAPIARENVAWQQGVQLQRMQIRELPLVTYQESTLTFYWQASEPLALPYRAQLAITNSQGQQVGLVNPLCDSAPSQTWHERETSNTRFFLVADATLPPDVYTLDLSLYDPQSGTILPLADGSQALSVGTLTVRQR